MGTVVEETLTGIDDQAQKGGFANVRMAKGVTQMIATTKLIGARKVAVFRQKKSNSSNWALLLATLLVTPLPAAAEVFTCDVKSHGPYKIIAEKIVFDVDARTKKVMVADGVLAYFEQMPTTGKLQRFNEKNVIVTWKLRASVGNDRHRGVPETFSYKAVYDRRSQKVTVSAYFDPIDQVKGTGKCVSAKTKAEKKQKRPDTVDTESSKRKSKTFDEDRCEDTVDLAWQSRNCF